MGMITVYAPDGSPRNFPDTMTEAEISEVMRQQFPAPEYPAPPSSGEVIKDFGDGSYLMGLGNQRVFVDQISGAALTDPLKIAEIVGERGAEGAVGRQRAGEISRGEIAQEQVTPLASRIFSGTKQIPFFREMVEPLAAATRTATAGTPFNENLDIVKRAVDRRAQEAPATSFMSRLLAGGAISAPFAAKQMATSRLTKAGEGALVGGVAGGSEGLVSGALEGYFADPNLPFTERLAAARDEALRQGQIGGAAGTGIGAASPTVGEVVGGIYGRYLREPVRDIVESIGFKDDATRVVQDALAADAAGAVESAQSVGPYGSISTLGPNTQALLDVVANSPSEGARIARENLKETAGVASKDLVNTLDTELGTPSAGLLTQKADIMKDTAAARRELYGKAYEFEITPETEGGAAILSDFAKVSQKDLAGARELLVEAGENADFIGGKRVSANQIDSTLNELSPAERSAVDVFENADGSYTVTGRPSVATIDYVTRRLADEANSLRISGNAAAAQSKRNLAMQLRSKLDQVNPDYAAARASGKDAIDQKLAADLGNDILNPRTTREDVALGLTGLDETAMGQLRQALRNRIDELAANAKVNPRGDNDAEVVEALAVLKSLNTRAVKEKLTMALGEDAAGRIGAQINDTSSALTQAASVALGSKTAIRQMIADRMKELVGESLGEKVSRQGLLPTAAGAATDALIGGPSQSQRIREVSSEIAPVLTQRKTPAQLQAEARQLERMTRLMDTANRRARAAESGVRGAGMGLITQQTSQGPSSRTEGLLGSVGMGVYGR